MIKEKIAVVAYHHNRELLNMRVISLKSCGHIAGWFRIDIVIRDDKVPMCAFLKSADMVWLVVDELFPGRSGAHVAHLSPGSPNPKGSLLDELPEPDT